MELSHLKQFLVLSKTENMREASEILYISQPNLSRNIKTLEADLGYPLFDRVKKRLILNKNGQEAKACVQRIFNEIENLQRINIRSKERIPLNFVGNGAVYYDILLPMLTKELPWYETQCFTCNTLEEKIQMSTRLEDVISFGVGEDIQVLSPEFDAKFLFTDRLCLSVPDKYPLAARKSLQIEELEQVLSQLPVILSSHCESTASNALLRKYAIKLRPAYTTSLPLNSRHLTNNDGIIFDSLLMSYFPSSNSRKFIPIMHDDAKFDVYIIFRKTEQSYTNTAIEWLIDFFKEINN